MTNSNARGSTERSGLQALYTFTPFKVLSGGEKYNMVVLNLNYMESKEYIYKKTHQGKLKLMSQKILDDKRDALLTCHEFTFVKAGKEACYPRVINAFSFSKDGENKIVINFTHIDAKKGITGDAKSMPFPRYIELSYESLTAGYYCSYGLVYLSSKSECPLWDRCGVRKGKGSRCMYYSRVPTSYERLYHVYPHIVTDLCSTYRNAGSKVEGLIFTRLNGKVRILGKVTLEHNLSFIAVADASIAIPKQRDSMDKDFIYLSFRTPIGFRLSGLKGMSIKYNKQLLREYIKKVLSNNKEVYNWIAQKYLIYTWKNKYKLKRLSTDIQSSSGFEAYFKWSGKFYETLSKKPKDLEERRDGINLDELTNFASFVYIHSLAHLLLSQANAVAGRQGDNIAYFIKHELLGNVRDLEGLYIIETMAGGLGYVEALMDSLLDRNSPLSAGKGVKSLEEHWKKSALEVLQNLQNALNKYKSQLADVTNTVSDIFDKYKKVFSKTFPYYATLRNYLIEKDRFENKNIIEQNRESFTSLISELPQCWDGCKMCLHLERGCMFGPYDQPFLLSLSLGKRALRSLSRGHFAKRKELSKTSPSVDLSLLFEDLINLAERSIKIVSPWISEKVIDELGELHKKRRNVKITVVTTDCEKNRNAIEKAKKYGFDVYVVTEDAKEKLHWKVLIVDDEIGWDGSANFTWSGLTENKESITISVEKKFVENCLKMFEDSVNIARKVQDNTQSNG